MLTITPGVPIVWVADASLIAIALLVIFPWLAVCVTLPCVTTVEWLFVAVSVCVSLLEWLCVFADELTSAPAALI